MSKGLRHFTGPALQHAVERRLRQGGGGLGFLAARDYQAKMELKAINKKYERTGKVSKEDLQRAVEIVK